MKTIILIVLFIIISQFGHSQYQIKQSVGFPCYPSNYIQLKIGIETNLPANSWEYSISWGDGTTECKNYATSSRIFDHTYNSSGEKTITYSIRREVIDYTYGQRISLDVIKYKKVNITIPSVSIYDYFYALNYNTPIWTIDLTSNFYVKQQISLNPNPKNFTDFTITKKWYVNGLPAGTGNSLTYTFSNPGTYIVKLRTEATACNTTWFMEITKNGIVNQFGYVYLDYNSKIITGSIVNQTDIQSQSASSNVLATELLTTENYTVNADQSIVINNSSSNNYGYPNSYSSTNNYTSNYNTSSYNPSSYYQNSSILGISDVKQNLTADVSILSNTIVNINFSSEPNSIIKMSVYDMTGKLVNSNEINQTGLNYQYDLSNIGVKSGIYFIKVEGGGLNTTKKILLN